MNSLANMFQQALPNMPRLNQRLQEGRFAQPGFQSPQQPQQSPQLPQGFQQGGAFQPSSNPLQFNQRQPVQNHQYNPPAWANYAGNQQQFGNRGEFGGAFQPRLGSGYFDGDLGQPDQGWKPWGGWGG